MTTKLKWRLGKLPTSNEVIDLLTQKLITKEEAREILFNEIDESKRDEESLKEEIKFLKELVSKLTSRSNIVETIRYVEKPYSTYTWYRPYEVYCSTGIPNSSYTTATLGTNNLTYADCSNSSLLCASGTGASYLSQLSNTGSTDDGDSFSKIETF